MTNNRKLRLLSLGASAFTLSAGVAIFSAGPAAAACGTLNVQDDVQVLDATAVENAQNACPASAWKIWTSNTDATSNPAFDTDVRNLLGGMYSVAIGHNPQSNYTTVQVNPTAAGITREQADTASVSAAQVFDNTYSADRNNPTTAMVAAMRSLNSSIVSDHGGSAAGAPANQVPSVPTAQLSPNIAAPAVHHSGWRTFWWIAIPVIALLLLGGLLRRLLSRNRSVSARSAAYTRTTPVATSPAMRTATQPTVPDVAPVAPPEIRPAMTTPPITQPMTRSEGDDLVTYEIRAADGRAHELHYVDRGNGPTAGDWIDETGTPQGDAGQTWWRPGVKESGETK